MLKDIRLYAVLFAALLLVASAFNWIRAFYYLNRFYTPVTEIIPIEWITGPIGLLFTVASSITFVWEKERQSVKAMAIFILVFSAIGIGLLVLLAPHFH